MKVLLDTDLASAFAKVGRMELLGQLFAGLDLGIAFEVHKELLVPPWARLSLPGGYFCAGRDDLSKSGGDGDSPTAFDRRERPWAR